VDSSADSSANGFADDLGSVDGSVDDLGSIRYAAASLGFRLN
jgi:hypothetical protein